LVEGARGQRHAARAPQVAWREGRCYEQLLDAVYKRRGWTNNGVPTIETLQRLRVDFPWVVEVVKPHLAG